MSDHNAGNINNKMDPSAKPFSPNFVTNSSAVPPQQAFGTRATGYQGPSMVGGGSTAFHSGGGVPPHAAGGRSGPPAHHVAGGYSTGNNGGGHHPQHRGAYQPNNNNNNGFQGGGGYSSGGGGNNNNMGGGGFGGSGMAYGNNNNNNGGGNYGNQMNGSASGQGAWNANVNNNFGPNGPASGHVNNYQQGGRGGHQQHHSHMGGNNNNFNNNNTFNNGPNNNSVGHSGGGGSLMSHHNHNNGMVMAGGGVGGVSSLANSASVAPFVSSNMMVGGGGGGVAPIMGGGGGIVSLTPSGTPNSGPPILLLLDSDAFESSSIAAHLATAHNYVHLVVDNNESVATIHYKMFRDALKKHTEAVKANPAEYANRGLVVEMKIGFHYTEMFYFFDEMRQAKLFPTHIAYVDHPSLDTIPGTAGYTVDQRTHHPLAFETCSLLFQGDDCNFLQLVSAFPDHDKDYEGCEAMGELLGFLGKPGKPFTKLPEAEGVFKLLSHLPDSGRLTALTDRLLDVFGTTELFSRLPEYTLDYAQITRNSFTFPHFWTTIDMNGIDSVIAKIDGKVYVFFPKYIALALLSPEQIPEPLRNMTAGSLSSPTTSEPPTGAKKSGITSPVSADAAGTPPPAATTTTAGSPSDQGIAWVINATITYSISNATNRNDDSCTIYAKDIILANGVVVAGQSFDSRWKLLKELVAEAPPKDSDVILLRQRYYPALDTEVIFKKIELHGSEATTTGNGLWYVNPGAAELRETSKWNFRYTLPKGGFDARLWNAKELDGGKQWEFEIHIIKNDGLEDAIGNIIVDSETVSDEALNDGQIIRAVVETEVVDVVVEAPPAPQPKKGGKPAPKASAPATVTRQEIRHVFKYMSRQHWKFVPTNDDPTRKNLPQKDLLEALAALK